MTLLSVFTPPRSTAPVSTDPLWRGAYAICRSMKSAACSCESFANEPCPRFLLASCAAEREFDREQESAA